MGPGADVMQAQVNAVTALGGLAVPVEGTLAAEAVTDLPNVAGVIWWGDADMGRAFETALSKRTGPITALITATLDIAHVMHERHVCIDTTAAGGNAALLAEVGVLTP